MDFAGPLVEVIKGLWGLASKPFGYIYNLKDNVDLLRNETKDLKAKSEDMKARVEREEGGGGMRRLKQVENCFLREAGGRDQIKCLGRCLPRNCRSSYRLGKRVDQMLKEARDLQTKEGKLSVLMSLLPSPPVLKMPMDETMGLDISKFNKVWKWLVDEKQARVIGLYGIGGGVVVSRQVNENSIRDTMRKRLHIQDESWKGWSQDERKFLLLIDDVWARLDLSKIRVPCSVLKNGSKVVITTRSEQVCGQMGADETFKVHCLVAKEALELFENSVGKSLVDYHQEIQDLAKDIVEECKGLPLTLITIGRAMAKKDNHPEWRHALTMLRNNPYKLSGIYNSLNDSTLQACFLYRCLFPEDYPIRSNELIELWIGEGLLRNTDDVYHLRDEGQSILGDLKRACLLEIMHDECVKMHDVIRDMAIWIARCHGQRENKLLVIENEEDMYAEKISKWGEAEKISLWEEQIENINRIPPECSQLKTLFVRETHVSLVPRGFFDSMTAHLMILDLSSNRNIELFPEEICNLINLCYLNLSNTSISQLPMKIKNLTRLWAIASLPLNVFSQLSESIHRSSQVNEEEIVEELGCMPNLIDLSIDVCNSSSALKIFQYPSLRRSLRIAGITAHLKELYIWRCFMLREIEITQGVGRAPDCSCFSNFVTVVVGACGFLNLSWLVHIPKLQNLIIRQCNSMEEITGDGFTPEELVASGLFSRLKRLDISDLPNLTSICEQTLPFPQLKSLGITRCPRLGKLPLDSNSARGSLEEVRVEADWWAKLEWEDDAARAHFTAKVQYRGPFA
ncbi:hypothetical protein EUGRSUZ_F04170 [Eucalyptus grandis]|uniref:Uncharacterized protein n=2 Tax=Eucalyptus grandis TaxID=71139 RepID=A0A059BYP9_EUCGR|nr:hypothetical protein EUGRSUZ_F04170 [Eucalyptus grandis]